MITALVILAIGAPQASPTALSSVTQAPDCQKLIVAEPTGDIATLCAGASMLLNARQQHPDDVELLKALWKFYERLASAAQLTEFGRERESDKSAPGQPDANGFYAMGGNVRAPRPTQDRVPMEYPKEAQALGIEGVVELEVRIDEAGQVVEARVVRSIPLLDDAAIAAARRWRFEPAVIDGRAVPVKLTMEMSFSPKRQPGR